MKVRKVSGRWVIACGLLLSVFFFAGCGTQSTDSRFAVLSGDLGAPAGNLTPAASTTAENNQPAKVAGGSADLLRVGDPLNVTFSDLPVLTQPFEIRIKDDGTITLLLNQTFAAAGKTIGQLEKEIRARYVPAYYINMTVTVKQQEGTRFYYVGGEVKAPGRQVYVSRITVLKAIQSAGDFTDFAKKTKVQLTRVDGQNLIVNCIKARKDPSLDLEVYPGDKIHVPRSLW